MASDGENHEPNRSTLPNYRKTDLVALIAAAQEKCMKTLKDHDSGARNGEAVEIRRNDDEHETCTPSASPPPQSNGDTFTYKDLIKIQAPMVRCSRPPFRKLCRLWGTTINYTHMIMSESFARSQEARLSDFALYDGENRLVTQLAGTSGPTMATAAAMVAPYCDAIDINCGCPQKWAMREGVGAALLKKPELVADMVKCIRNAVPGTLIPCVVKMRVDDDTSKSVDFARQCVAAGASWITVHGRTPWDTPSANVRTQVITLIRDSIDVPVVANGSVESPRTAMGLALSAGVGAVMSGRGLLSNPAAFFDPDDASSLSYRVSYEEDTLPWERPATNPASSALLNHPMLLPQKLSSSVMCPVEVISDFIRLAAACDLPIKATQHHLLLMAHDYLSPTERSYIAQQRSIIGLTRCMHDVNLYTSKGRATDFPFCE